MSKSIRTEDGQELEVKEGQILDASGHTLDSGPNIPKGPQIRIINFRAFPIMGLIGGVIAIAAFGGFIAVIIGLALAFGLIGMILRPLFSLFGIQIPTGRTFIGRNIFIKRR